MKLTFKKLIYFLTILNLLAGVYFEKNWARDVSIALLIIFLLYEERITQISLFELKSEVKNNFRQIESLLNLYNIIKIRGILPKTRGWASSPDFLCEIARTCLKIKPKTVVELGSGVSTILIAYCLNINKNGILISVDNNLNYLEKTKEYIKDHDLMQYVQFCYSPLRSYKNKEIEQYEQTPINRLWYDNSSWDFDKIDLLVIDGPPGGTCYLSRLPSLIELKKKMNKNGIIMLDDAKREDIVKCLLIWKEKYPEIRITKIDNEKGTAIIQV